LKSKLPVARMTPVAAAALMALAGLLPTVATAQTSTPAASDGPKLQEVVITSQKRTERLKDTPVAAAVVSAELLEKANASDISDINQLVPSVQLKGSFNGRVPMAMRGISTNANEAAVGLTSGVSILIDGVPVPSDSTAANELQDVRRVEVLKGPQSTLGGRTASAGVINFVTQSPSRSLSGSLGLTLTNDKERKLNGFLSGPVNDLLSFSVSAYRNEREYPIRNLLLNENSRSDSAGGRAKLLLSPDKDLDITLTARTAEGHSTGGTFTYQYLTPGAELFPYFPWNGGHGITQDKALPGVNVRYGNTDYASPVHMTSNTRDQDVSLNIEKRIGAYTFTSTTARQSETQKLVQDVPAVAVYFLDELRLPAIPLPPVPGVPPLFDNTQKIAVKPVSLTQEFKIASPLNQPVSYVAGVFYSDVKVVQNHERSMFVNPKVDDTESISKTLGVYGRATWNLNEQTSLLTGLRFNRDDIRYSIVDHSGGFTSSGSDSANALVGDLTLRQKLGKDHMVYGTLSRGYKPRAYNTAQTLSSNDALTPVGKETIHHLELGAKSSLLGGALALNAALFNTQYKDYQVQIYDNTSVIANLMLSNAGEARTRGLELDATLAATERTKLSASAAYIDAQFVKYAGAPCFPGQTAAQGCTTVVDANGKRTSSQDLAGKTMPDSPKLKISLSAEHNLAQSLMPWDLRLNAQYAWRSASVLQANQNPYTRQGAFGILNLSGTATSADGRHAITLFVNNVTNRFYLVNAEDFWSGLWGGSANAVIGQPARDAQRYGGIRYNYTFD